MHPKISFIATSRNDNHGGDLLNRMNIFINNLSCKAEETKLPIEVIIVEWNPPSENVYLKDALNFININDYCQVKIIEVPVSIHNRYKYSASLPIYQMIAKNVGARHASADYLLLTNVDLIFSEEMFNFFRNSQLDENVLYRCDRYDVSKDIYNISNPKEYDEFCLKNTVIINNKQGIFSTKTNKVLCVNNISQEDYCSMYGIKDILHTNACGDFQLISKAKFYSLKGYPELDLFSFHLDSIFEFMCYHAKIKEYVLPIPVYHIVHDLSWTDDDKVNKNTMDFFRKKKIKVLTSEDLKSYATVMSALNYPLILNDDNWGLSDYELKVTEINTDKYYFQSGKKLDTPFVFDKYNNIINREPYTKLDYKSILNKLKFENNNSIEINTNKYDLISDYVKLNGISKSLIIGLSVPIIPIVINQAIKNIQLSLVDTNPNQYLDLLRFFPLLPTQFTFIKKTINDFLSENSNLANASDFIYYNCSDHPTNHNFRNFVEYLLCNLDSGVSICIDNVYCYNITNTDTEISLVQQFLKETNNQFNYCDVYTYRKDDKFFIATFNVELLFGFIENNNIDYSFENNLLFFKSVINAKLPKQPLREKYTNNPFKYFYVDPEKVLLEKSIVDICGFAANYFYLDKKESFKFFMNIFQIFNEGGYINYVSGLCYSIAVCLIHTNNIDKSLTFLEMEAKSPKPHPDLDKLKNFVIKFLAEKEEYLRSKGNK